LTGLLYGCILKIKRGVFAERPRRKSGRSSQEIECIDEVDEAEEDIEEDIED
jgi:hypothetical protein